MSSAPKVHAALKRRSGEGARWRSATTLCYPSGMRDPVTRGARDFLVTDVASEVTCERCRRAGSML